MRTPQADVARWHRATFGEGDHLLSWIGNKLAAESGEVNQALLSADGEPRRNGRIYENLREEAADVLICLYAIADRAGFDLGVAFWERFGAVSRREYAKVPP